MEESCADIKEKLQLIDKLKKKNYKTSLRLR